MKRRATIVLALFLSPLPFLLLCGCDVGASSGSGTGDGASDAADGLGGSPESGDTELNAATGSLVTLGPTGDLGLSGDDVSCRWRQLAGPVKLELDEATASSCEPRIRPTVEGVYLFELTTTDSSGRSETETVLLRVGENEFPTGAPIAIAGDDQTVGEGSPVTLDGGRSRDPDGDTLIFIWRQVRGVEAGLSGNTVADPTFVAPFVERDTELVFELAVNDGALGSTDTCSITVLDRGYDEECRTNADCDDGRFCNGQEQCVGGVCQNGPAPCIAATEECDEVTDACLAVPVPPEDDGGDQLECETDDDCHDGLFCNGVETCVAGVCVAGNAPCTQGMACDEDSDSCVAPADCQSNQDCDDGSFCNGAEVCDIEGVCQSGTVPCPAQMCDEAADVCAECLADADCDDDLFCNGQEECIEGACQTGSTPCTPDEVCNDHTDACDPPPLPDGVWLVDASATGANDGTSWANAFTSLQDALAAASSGEEIWVAAGTYKPGDSREATFQLVSGTAVYGGFAGNETSRGRRDFETNVTTLSGEIGVAGDTADNTYHVVTGSGTDTTAVLDGFTITGGNADGAPHDQNGSGGGMYNYAGSPTVTNCTFSANSAEYYGAGMLNYMSSSPTVTYCTFSGNSALAGGGMFTWESSNPTVTNCTFSGNSAVGPLADGGGMYNHTQSNPTVSNCTFSGNSAGNSGGGMINYNSSSPTVTDCTFSGNSATGTDGDGGGMYNHTQSNPTVSNCTFSGNSAGHGGGGMMNYNQASPTVTNCTFSENSAQWYGGGMFNFVSSSPTLTDCAFSGNSAAKSGGAMFNWDSSNPTTANCAFSGNSADLGGGGMLNLAASPTMTNCTFSGNSAVYNGGGLSNSWTSSPTLANCILWGNTAPTGPQIFDDATTTIATHSCIAGGWTGNGNIDTNPLFVDADGMDGTVGTEDDNLRLAAGSPCIDAGDNAALPGGTTTDLDGAARFVDDPSTADTGSGTPPLVDMGAYEYTPN